MKVAMKDEEERRLCGGRWIVREKKKNKQTLLSVQTSGRGLILCLKFQIKQPSRETRCVSHQKSPAKASAFLGFD